MTQNTPSYRPVLLFGCLILIISFGARSSFGLFMPEMTAARGWSRELFSLSFAIQNLVWGLAASFLGAMADRYGSRRVLALGGVLYAAGLFGMAFAESGAMLILTSGVLMGVAVGATSFGIIFATLGKIVPAQHRTMAFGVGVAAGSMGQFLFLPFSASLMSSVGWQQALVVLGLASSVIVALALGVRGDSAEAVSAQAEPETGFRVALSSAMRDRNFHLLFWGFFVCGLQVVFIALHLPAYLVDKGMSANIGATAIALVGLFNIAGSLISGWMGQRVSKKWMLTAIYVARSIVMIGFLAMPLTEASVYVFSALMGLLWLSTVAPTNALVGQIWGVRHLGMLGGVVFFGHQIGSFFGAWLGGRIFDTTGSYDMAWLMAIVFGAFAAVMHAPIDQRPRAQRMAPAV
ncbi:MAG: MFS transporter [Burkholderiaceae bacterium]